MDSAPEQLNQLFEVVEAAQRDPEYEQLNNGFPESNEKQTFTKIDFVQIYLINKSDNDIQLYLLVT